MTWDQQNKIADNKSPDTASPGSFDLVSGVLASSSSLRTDNGNGRESETSQRPGPQQQQPAAQQQQAQHKTRTLAPNLTRRSHKKSRGGCYSCKNRKIKCGEQKPTCSSCAMKGLTCIYPTDTTSRNNHNKSTMTMAQTPLPVLRRNPTTGPSFSGDHGGIEGETSSSFSMLDMRFFHHFLMVAFPHLPVDNDSVWVHEIPQFAEQHGYLMHAILSLGASHLGRLTGVDYRRESLVHRGQALAGLNRALSHQQGTLRYGESDAMLASCYALTFQASYMGDGLADFITMVRGCALTTSKILQDQAPTAFKLDPESHFRFMSPRLHRLPAVDPQHLREGHQALQRISEALNLNLSSFATTTTTDREAEVNFHAALVDVIVGLQTSPATGYLHFMAVYTVWAGLGHDSFKSFLDPDNLVAQLLLAYFVAIQLLMVPLATHEWGRHRPAPDQARARARVLFGVIEWAHSIFKHLGQTDLNVHLDWPRKIAAIANAEIRGLLLQSPPVLQLHLTPTTETDDNDDNLGLGVAVAAAAVDPEAVADLNQLCAAHRQLYTTP